MLLFSFYAISLKIFANKLGCNYISIFDTRRNELPLEEHVVEIVYFSLVEDSFSVDH